MAAWWGTWTSIGRGALRVLVAHPCWTASIVFQGKTTNSVTRRFSHVAVDRKPIVVILPWLSAPRPAIKKYEDLYARYGYESFVHQTSLKNFLWPKSGLQSSLMVLDELKQKIEANGDVDSEIVVHSFSIGCYFYALMLWQMNRNSERFQSMQKSIVAHVCDSPVVGTLTEMATGVGKMMSPKSRMLADIYKSLCLIYFGITKSHTTFLYDELISTFKHSSPKVPSLMLTSENDPMQISEAFEDLCESWNDGRFLSQKIWKDSRHAQHLRFHPKEYEDLLQTLLSESKRSWGM